MPNPVNNAITTSSMPTAITCARAPVVTDTACTDAATRMITVPVMRGEASATPSKADMYCPNAKASAPSGTAKPTSSETQPAK